MSRGHVTKKSKVSWTIVYELPPDPVTGKRRQKSEAVRGTKKHAEKVLAKRMTAIDNHTYTEPHAMTVGEFLERWLKDYAESNLRESTYRSYRANIENHILPMIGGVQLKRLRPAHIQDLLREKLENGNMKEGGGLSRRSVQYLHSILRRALNHAVKWQLLPHNPCSAVEAPTPKTQEMQYWTQEQAQQFLNQVRNYRLYALYRLAITTGMRRGEMLGLTWENIDFDQQQVRVRYTLQSLLKGEWKLSPPKTEASIRTIAIGEDDVQILRTHRRQQAEERLLLGPEYEDNGLVFPTSIGTPMRPRNLYRHFKREAEKAGLPEIRFHDLRHTHATMLLLLGEHPKVVQERLGHTKIETTLNTYSHVLPNMQAKAAQALDSMMKSPENTSETGR